MVSLYTLSTGDGGNVHLFPMKSGSKELQYRAIIIQIAVLMIAIKICIHVWNTTLI